MYGVELHGGTMKRCCGSAMLPGRGNGALWGCALGGCVQSGTTLWCCETVIGAVIHCRGTGALRCIAEHCMWVH